MSGSQDIPVDDLFLKMFMKTGRHHPLIHMAWADWCTHGNNTLHEAFLKGNIFRDDWSVDRIWSHIQRDLVWRYLYPSPLFLGKLVEALIQVLFEWTESPAQGAKFLEIAGVLHKNSELFGKTTRSQFLGNIRRSLTGGFFKWGDLSEPEAKHFESFGALHEFLPSILEQIGESQLYDPLIAKTILGDQDLGYSNNTKLIPVLMRPLATLVDFVGAHEDPAFSFGKGEYSELTAFGQLHHDLSTYHVLDRSLEQSLGFFKLGVAHFLMPPPGAGYIRRWGNRNVSGKDVEHFAAMRGYLAAEAELRGPGVFFRQCLALGGFNFAKWTLPAIKALGQKYTTEEGKTLGTNWLQTAAGTKRELLNRLQIPADTNINTKTWEGIKQNLAHWRYDWDQTQEIKGGAQLQTAAETERPPESKAEEVEPTKKRKRVSFGERGTVPDPGMAQIFAEPQTEWAWPSGFTAGEVRPFEIEDLRKDATGTGYGPLYLAVGGVALAFLAFAS